MPTSPTAEAAARMEQVWAIVDIASKIGLGLLLAFAAWWDRRRSKEPKESCAACLKPLVAEIKATGEAVETAVDKMETVANMHADTSAERSKRIEGMLGRILDRIPSKG